MKLHSMFVNINYNILRHKIYRAGFNVTMIHHRSLITYRILEKRLAIEVQKKTYTNVNVDTDEVNVS